MNGPHVIVSTTSSPANS